MTTPVHFLSDFKGKFKIPNNDEKILRIINNNQDLGRAQKGKRSIMLYEEGLCVNHNTEKIIYSPRRIFEYDGDGEEYDDESIIQFFHNDDIEFI